MNNIKEQIRAEVERRKKICEGVFERESDTYYQGKAVAYGELLSFIDSLPEEKPEDFNDAFDKYMKEEWSHGTQLNDIARHFYELGQASVPMPEEKPSKELETEIATWIPAHLKGNVDEDIIDAVKRWGENVARHFVEWQKEHTEDYPMPEDTVLFQKGVAEGKRLMMEDAVEDLPKWKKNAGVLRYGILEDEHGRYIQHDGYKLYFDDLLKLPKEDEK